MESWSHDLKAAAESLPEWPGVYRFLDETGRVVYVGKAKNLKKRASSYFSGSHAPRVMAMLRQARKLEMTVTETENEALILEANLIKQFKPPYNVLLKDDKSHPYLHLNVEHPFPRLSLYRGQRREAGRFFGPYPSVHAVRDTLKWLQNVFPIRQCGNLQFSNRSRPCLQYQIKRCTGPCCGREAKEAYALRVEQLILFLEGRDKTIERDIKKAMWEASEALDFEAAARLRDRLHCLKQVQDRRRLNLSRELDLDVVVVLKQDGVAVVLFLFVRRGLLLGIRSFFPENVADVAVDEVMGSFMGQYYSNPFNRFEQGSGGGDTTWPPPEILVNVDLPDAAWLAGVLTRLRGSNVHFLRPMRGEKRVLLEMGEKNAGELLLRRIGTHNAQGRDLMQLARVLDMDQVPERIEAYDISHFQDAQPSGSLVVFTVDGFQKGAYRRFAIQDETLADDTARMAEVLSRRLLALKEGQGGEGGDIAQPWPDLILLDGGVGQLNAVLEIALELQVDGIVFCAIAKGPQRNAGRERLFLPGRDEAIILPHDSPVLMLLQKIRDEAHRFAVGFHRVRRKKEQRRSLLDDIPGIGLKKKRALLRQFGSVRAIQEAGTETLMTVQGISSELARRIEQHLKKGTD
ncbi:MAG: Excinuclease ABC subunit C [Magnetococcales bacterium]|nr:Excinuclease ABC subunit C [Magnetococcales bacterium]HIJ82823.1 excinuclease ABC subunit UvrC [Magnetococcales bacterium]